MSRGILSIYWGDESRLPIERLKSSVKKFHPDLPHEVIKVDTPLSGASSLNIKASMFDLSPFEETLFLDMDTVVMSDISFGFDKVKLHGLCISICECPWARRYPRIFNGDQIEYNTGVIFFSKKSRPVFERWKSLAISVDSSIVGVSNKLDCEFTGAPVGEIYKMSANDQGSFALAIEETNFNPYVLPLNWNFRPPWHQNFYGPIKIWHSYADPPSFLYEISDYYQNSDAIIQHHF